MDARSIMDQIAAAPGGPLEKIQALLQAEQADRDEQRAQREMRQAKWQVFQLVSLLAAVAAVIVSLVAITDQRESAARQDQAARYSSISQLSLELEKAIAEHPRLISCLWFNNCRQPKLTAKQIRQAKVFSAYIVDFYQYLYTQLENFGAAPDSGEFILREDATPADDENWITWGETIVSGFGGSTMVCDHLENNADAYEQRFVHAVAVAKIRDAKTGAKTDVCPNLIDPGPVVDPAGCPAAGLMCIVPEPRREGGLETHLLSRSGRFERADAETSATEVVRRRVGNA